MGTLVPTRQLERRRTHAHSDNTGQRLPASPEQVLYTRGLIVPAKMPLANVSEETVTIRDSALSEATAVVFRSVMEYGRSMCGFGCKSG